MNKNAARWRDTATCDTHAVGPIVEASRNVSINRRPAARQQDQGQHRAGERGAFLLAEGAPCVLVNGRRMARRLDRVANVHGIGHIASGSPNVLVGDYGKEQAQRAPAKLTVTIRLHDMPLPGARIRTSTGASGLTGEDGTVTLEGLERGVIDVFLGNKAIWRVLVLGGEWLRLEAQLAMPINVCTTRYTRVNLAGGK